MGSIELRLLGLVRLVGKEKLLSVFSLGIQVSTALIQKGNLGQCYEYLSNVQGAI